MAARKIETHLIVSGDQEYIDKLTKVNETLSAEKSGLTLLDKQYKENRNSLEYLTKRVDQMRTTEEAHAAVLAEAKAGYENANKTLEKYEAELQEAKSKVEEIEKELKTLDTTTEEGAKQQEELTKELEKYQQEQAKAQENTNKAKEAVADWKEQQDIAKKSLNNFSSSLITYEGYLDEARNSEDGFATSIDAAGHKVKTAAKDQDELNKKYEDTGAAVDALAGSLAANLITKSAKEIAAALNECITAAANFETAMAKVGTIADTESVSLGDMQGSILALSSETGKAASDLADATYNAISAGVDTASAVEFVATANKLATGGFTDSTTAVDILTTALNAYGLEVDQVSNVSDYLITTQNLGKTTVDELASSLGKVIPIASTYNVEMDNLSAAMAILTANGIATAESTTYLKAALNELGDSGSTVGTTLVEQTGKSFSQLSQEGYSLGDVMEILAASVDNDKGKFNELWSSSEAGVGALSILSSGSAKYNEVLTQMQISAGATEKAYAKMADTTEMASQKLTNAFDNLKIAVGNELQDQISGVYEKGAELINWATDFVETNEWLIPIIESVTASLGFMAAGITGVTLVMKILIPLWKEFNEVALSSTVGKIAVAAGVLVAALTPLIMSLSNTTDAVDAETAAWREQASALKDATAAYNDARLATAENESNVSSLAKALEDLVSKEDGSVSSKEAIISLVDQLNEKIPDLNLSYNELTGSINMTNAELEHYIETEQLQEKYENAAGNYSTIYAQKLEATESLEGANKKLAEAQQELNAKYEKYSKISSINHEDAQKAAKDIQDSEKKVADLQTTVTDLNDSISESNSALAAAQYDMNMYTIESANMTEAEREEIDAMLEKAETMHGYLPAYYEEIDAIAALASEHNEAYTQAQADMEAQVQKIQELQEAYDSSYESAYNSITNQLGLFDEMQVGTSQSIDSMISGLDSQIEYMDQYAENMRQAMELGVNEGILQQLSDGSEESAAILQEIVNSGQDKIQELNEKFGQVEEGKDNFASAMAEMETQYSADLDTLIADTEAAVQDMAKYDDAYESAQQTCNGIIAGIDSKWSSVIAKYTALANAAVAAYNNAMVIQSPSKRFKWSSEMTMAGIEVGINEKQNEVLQSYTDLAKESVSAYETEMKKISEQGSMISSIARVPQVIKERYITANNNASTTNNNSTTQNFYISTPVKSPSEMMRAARLEAKYGLAGA
jgi:TP901 family phage tail tape measure protein